MRVLFVSLGAVVLLWALWRVRFGARAPGPRVLCFHKVTPGFCLEGTWTTPKRFEASIAAVAARGYRFLDETAYLDALAAARPPAGKDPEPGAADRGAAFERPGVWITFDDAYESVYEHAFGVLARRGIPFHLFVVSAYAGRDNAWEIGLGRAPHRHASWEQIAEMVRAGATVGSHTAAHADLTRLGPDRLRDELVRSKETIEDRLGVAVRTLSYPYGRYNGAVCRAARAAGYDAAFSLYPRGRNAVVDPMALRRDAVYVIDPAFIVPMKLGSGPVAVAEEMKCRAINAVAVLGPLLTRRREPAPGS